MTKTVLFLNVVCCAVAATSLIRCYQVQLKGKCLKLSIIVWDQMSNLTPNDFVLKFTQPPSFPLLRKRINFNFKSTTGINSFNVINFFYSHTLI